jgi:hypothetical protein
MRRNRHASRRVHRVRTVVVDEAPRADQAPGSLRQGAPNLHGAGATERYIARVEENYGR